MSDWPHAPLHRLDEEGTYMVTGGTYGKVHHLHSVERLNYFRDHLFRLAEEYGWFMQAWSVLANHYHFIAISLDNPRSLDTLLKRLHSETAATLNSLDAKPGRRVWYQFWDKQLTYQKSYLARLKYVHNNASHHGIIDDASDYPWCSMGWFTRRADRSFQRTVDSFKTDRLKIYDDFGSFPARERF